MMNTLIISLIFVAGLIAARALLKYRKSSVMFSVLFVSGLVAIDQLIKVLVVRNYPECKYAITRYFNFKIGNFSIFSLTHIRNDGAGWSILGGQTVFLSCFTAVVIIGLTVYMIIRRKKIGAMETVAVCLIIAGGFGNLIDRFRMLIEGTDKFSGVIDYFKFEFIDWPVFNFADCCVVVGAILFCLVMIIEEIGESKRKKRSARLLAAAVSDSEKDASDDEPL